MLNLRRRQLVTLLPPPHSRSAGGQRVPSPQMKEKRDGEVAGPPETVAELRRALAQCAAERDEALAQQIATAEVLAVISSSQAQLKPVFDAIVDKTTRICDATFACLGLFEAQALRFAAISGASADSEFFHPERLHQPDGCPYVVPLARAKRLYWLAMMYSSLIGVNRSWHWRRVTQFQRFMHFGNSLKAAV
jgi:hypothetical protein